MKQSSLFFLLSIILLSACKKDDALETVQEDPSSFSEIGSVSIGGTGAAEITAYDPSTKKLFVVTNTGSATKIDVINLSDPAAPSAMGSIDISIYGGYVNSVAVHDGKLAAAVEGVLKTDPGKAVTFKTSDHSLIKQVTVGAQPDMISFSKDGKYILTANEGEPNDAYTIDPAGTVSIITVADNYSVATIDFSSFASQLASLQAKGFRMFGPNASFVQDIEPEYITISSDSKTAWVTLQENNAIAKIDIPSKTVVSIMPLGFKNYNVDANAIDPSDKDMAMVLGKWNVKGMYQPDAIAVYEKNGIPYLFTANEGDVREWAAFAENKRVKDIALDLTAFPDGANLKLEAKLGRVDITRMSGDAGNDGDYDELYSFGSRSFSVWNGNTGDQVFDSKNELETKAIALGKYDDNRSDDKGVEPEGITLGMMGKKMIAFIGMERADLLAIYDVTDPLNPIFLKILSTGDAPEGITFIPADQSLSGKSLVIVSSENDGVIKIYRTN